VSSAKTGPYPDRLSALVLGQAIQESVAAIAPALERDEVNAVTRFFTGDSELEHRAKQLTADIEVIVSQFAQGNQRENLRVGLIEWNIVG